VEDGPGWSARSYVAADRGSGAQPYSERVMTQRLGKAHRGRCSDRTFGQGSIREPARRCFEGEETKYDVSRLRRCFWRLHAANEVLPGKSQVQLRPTSTRITMSARRTPTGWAERPILT
jgi:hypothetical protein